MRPFAIADAKVDCVVGNPPWLTYSRTSAIVRQELRDMSERRYQIWVGGRQAPHQDIAALFFCRVAELYLQRDGVIGMVLPHSTLRSGQHHKFRRGSLRGKANRARSQDQ